jgi:hypothetical protein
VKQGQFIKRPAGNSGLAPLPFTYQNSIFRFSFIIILAGQINFPYSATAQGRGTL